MKPLSKEELAELETLEREDKARLSDEANAAKRQHLEALRMSKRLTAKHGAPGKSFVVLETTLGNIAVRAPNEMEIDMITEDADRAALESFVASVVVEPAELEVRKLMADNPGLVGAVVTASSRMLKVVREEETKK